MSDGHELWRNETEGRPSGAPQVVAGCVYSCTAEGDVFAWQASDGRLLWRQVVGPILFSAPTCGDDVLYIAPAVNAPEVPRMLALDTDTGTVRWQAELPTSSTPPLVVGNGVVYATTHGGWLALHATDGTLLWRHDTDTPGLDFSAPCLLEHALYVSHGEHRWHRPDGQRRREFSIETYIGAMRAADGTLLWRQRLGAVTGASGWAPSPAPAASPRPQPGVASSTWGAWERVMDTCTRSTQRMGHRGGRGRRDRLEREGKAACSLPRSRATAACTSG